MEPVLTMVIGLDGSGREDVQAEGTRIRTAEEAVRLVKGGDSAVLDAPNLRARTRRGISGTAARCTRCQARRGDAAAGGAVPGALS